MLYPLADCQSGTWVAVGGGVKTRVAYNAVWGFRWPYIGVQCNANEVVIGGSGACTGGGGYGWVYSNSPTGNGWQVSCNDVQWETILAEVWAICAIK